MFNELIYKVIFLILRALKLKKKKMIVLEKGHVDKCLVMYFLSSIFVRKQIICIKHSGSYISLEKSSNILPMDSVSHILLSASREGIFECVRMKMSV